MDILIIATSYDPRNGEDVALDELIGCHGGASERQARAFLLFPTLWIDTYPLLCGTEAVHAALAATSTRAPERVSLQGRLGNVSGTPEEPFR